MIGRESRIGNKKEITAVKVLNAIDEVISELELQENYSDHYINFGWENRPYASDEHVGNNRVKKLFLEKRDKYLGLGSKRGAKGGFVTEFLKEEKSNFMNIAMTMDQRCL